MIRTPLSATALMLVAAACTTVPPPMAQQRPDSCTTDTIGWVIGQAATPEIVERAQFESYSRAVRVIEPGMAVTLDYRGDRLNLHVNSAGAINQATCG
ncbi:I78 family peptidase inhibitor [Lysobacter sp. A03]|uniref:I78 family peptidase inhibitor n=1 Tax=Lysobacter sp. A03 TaxID=1199154 RepID=UPI0005B69EA5|nr:I78 family peptidase inhibitor [Lysobacter sp. A03]KIQ96189.1 hypothetical protein TI01_2271 [Lysobacter sp. A03]